MQRLILVFSIFSLFVFFCCKNKNKEDNKKLCIVIRNETEEVIYMDDYYGIGTADYKEQEKIYYLSMYIAFTNKISHGNYNFKNKLYSFEERQIPIKNVLIDKVKYRYELNNDATLTKIYVGECETMSFRLFYTKKPIVGIGYKNYVEDMKMHGYYAIGYQEEDKIIFIIRTHVKIEGNI